MKFLFVVNSNITALCAKAVIVYEKISYDDVIILTMRGARVNGINLKHIEFIYPHIVNPIPQTRNIFKCRKALKIFDQFIFDITKDQPFFCFVNHNMARNTELMLTHANCTGFSILEEGSAAYNSLDYFRKINHRFSPSIWDLIGYKMRIRKRYFYRPDYQHVYAVTPNAFPGFRSKILLKDIFVAVNNKYAKYNNSIILVLNASVTFGTIDIEAFLKGLAIMISKSFENDILVYYKFHPAQPNNEREIFINFFSSYRIDFVQLSDELILEELIVSASNLSLYFNLSSLSIYANALGHKCYSFSGILADLSSSFKRRLDEVNSQLKSSTTSIQ